MWSSGSPSAEPRYTSFPADEGAQHVLALVDAAQPSDTTQRVSQPAVNAAQNSSRLCIGWEQPTGIEAVDTLGSSLHFTRPHPDGQREVAADAHLADVYAGPMTSGGTAGPGMTSPENAPHPPPPPPTAPYATPGPYARRPRRGRGLLAGIGIAVAVALAAAALVISLVTAHRNLSAPAAPPPAQPTNQAASTADSDKALCEAIAPLIKESNAEAKAFVALGNYGTPERDAGIPAYVAQTTDWVKRAQSVVDQHMTTARADYLMRSLQRFIDDVRAYASNIRPGPATDGDTAAWNDSLVALAGPLEVCGDLGVPLW